MVTIDVRTKDGIYEVDAQRVGETWAFHRFLDEGKKGEAVYGSSWTVTHVPSGCSYAAQIPKTVAKAMAEALVELGFDTVTSKSCEKAAEQLVQIGAVDLVQWWKLKQSLFPAAKQRRAIAEYVRDRLKGGPPRVFKGGDPVVPAALSSSPRGKKAAKRSEPRRGRSRKKRPKKPPAEPKELDLVALARRAKGNPFDPRSQFHPLW